jgi:PKD repeat protein
VKYATRSILITLLIPAIMLAACPREKGAPRIAAVSPWEVNLGNDQTNAVVQIAPVAADAEDRAFSVHTDTPWLHVTPASGVLGEVGARTPIIVLVLRTSMKPGGNLGAFTITLDGGEEHTVTVRAEATVVAEFHASTTESLVGEPVSFSDVSSVLTGASPIVRWHWKFGDGESSSERNPVHAYAKRGRYTVALTVESQDRSDTRTRIEYIHVRSPQVPTAGFVAATRQPVAGEPVQFIDISLPGTSPIASWRWDFGDGVWSVLRNPVHIYTAASVYDVNLTVSTQLGSDTEIKLGYMDVQPAPPDAEFATRE